MSRNTRSGAHNVVVTSSSSSSANPSAKSSRLDVELHPLKNVEILSMIFSFCSVTDLKNCRLVGSRLWLNESLSSWREKAVLLVLPKMGDEEESNPGIILKDLKRIYNDKKSPHRLRQKPFQNYKLKGFQGKYARNSEMKWVIDKLSSHMRYLALKNYQFPRLKIFLDTIFIKVPNLIELQLENAVAFTYYCQSWDAGHEIPLYPEHQNLKRIIVQMEDFHNDPVLPFWVPLDFILKKMVNLEELQIKWMEDDIGDWNRGEQSEEMRIMKAFANVRSEDGSGSKLQIKCLEIPDSVPLTENGFTAPVDFGLPLERFTGTIMEDILHLKAYSETLKFLKISFIENEHSAGEEEDQIAENGSENREKLSLPNLTELHVDGPPALVFKNLNKLVAPNLKTLLLDPDQVCGRANIKLADASFRNVTRLECFNARVSCYGVIDAKDCKQLSEFMPNVLHAKMPMTGDAFTELCKAWPNIRTLTISDCLLVRREFSPIDDESITGIATSGSGSEESRPPNITDLKHLTDFVLRYRVLTDHSVNFGFLHCPRLHSLSVNFKEISEEAESALQRKVSILNIHGLGEGLDLGIPNFIRP